MSSNHKLQNARILVEEQLHVKEFIDKYKEDIHNKLLDCYKDAKKEKNPEMMFIAETLPVISAVVHLGSKLNDFKSALCWVNTHIRGGTNPLTMVSVLTFIYIIQKACEQYCNAENSEQSTWKEINLWVHKWIGESGNEG